MGVEIWNERKNGPKALLFLEDVVDPLEWVIISSETSRQAHQCKIPIRKLIVTAL